MLGKLIFPIAVPFGLRFPPSVTLAFSSVSPVPNLDFSDNIIYSNELLPIYESRYGDPTSEYHAHAFDAANMILTGILETALISNDGIIIGRQALRDALYSTTNFQGATGVITCDQYGDCGASQTTIFEVIDGNLVPVWP